MLAAREFHGLSFLRSFCRDSLLRTMRALREMKKTSPLQKGKWGAAMKI
jgi:hypothetical protein